MGGRIRLDDDDVKKLVAIQLALDRVFPDLCTSHGECVKTSEQFEQLYSSLCLGSIVDGPHEASDDDDGIPTRRGLTTSPPSHTAAGAQSERGPPHLLL